MNPSYSHIGIRQAGGVSRDVSDGDLFDSPHEGAVIEAERKGGHKVMKEIFVVTHPEATHHVDGLVGGWYDSDLSPRGLRHAAAIAEALDERLAGRVVELYSSDLLRARRTAEPIGQRLGVEVIVDSDLREKSYGVAGRPQAWLDGRIRPLPESAERLLHDEGIAGAETRLELATRAYAAMRRIVEASAVHQVIITHGGTATICRIEYGRMRLCAPRPDERHSPRRDTPPPATAPELTRWGNAHGGL